MNRILLASALGLLSAATASADPPVAPAPTIVTAPAMAAPMPPATMNAVPMPMVDNTLVTPQRRMGLFGRMRSRNTAPMLNTTPAFTTMPTMTAPAGTAVPTPMPTTTPAPMPSGATKASAGVTGATVIAASANMPVETAAMTTEMQAPQMSTTAKQPRMGLLARLRMRNGK